MTKMKLTTSLLATALAFVLLGCDPEPKKGTTPTPEKPTPEAKSPTVADIAADLKGEAYSYYGLENNAPVPMEATYSNGMTLSGTQSITLKGIENGNPVFEISRTGDLVQLGTQEVTLEKDGLYVTKMDIGEAHHDLELPNDLKPGRTWTNHIKVDEAERQLDIKSTFKFVGPTKVKTGVGEREAILVTSTGSGTLNKKPVTMNSRNWYVRGVGGVKTEITTKFKGGDSTTIVVQEVKAPTETAPSPESKE